MKKISFKAKVIIYFLVLSFLGLVFYFLNQDRTNEISKILNGHRYTIGKVLEYSSGSNVKYVPKIGFYNKSNWIRYTYRINGRNYINSYDESYYKIPLSGVKIGHQYLVSYSSTDNNTSIIDLTKEVLDSAEFISK